MPCFGITDNCDDNSHSHHISRPSASPPPNKAVLVHHHHQSEAEEEIQAEKLRGEETTDTSISTDVDDDDDLTDYCTARNTTAYYVNGEACYTTSDTCTAAISTHEATTTDIHRTIFSTTSNNNANKTEVCTSTLKYDSSIPSTTAADGAVFVDDYVVGNSGEEVARGYKTVGTGSELQSELNVQQQQQQPEQGVLALISNVGLFLDQTWNWLHYFLVTIIFLNLVHFVSFISHSHPPQSQFEELAGGGTEEANASVVGEQVQGAQSTKQNEQLDHPDISSCEASGNIATIASVNNSSLVEHKIISEVEITMSPNTCSIQNQQEVEVENAEEAIMAVGVGGTEEKVEIAAEAVIPTTTTEVPKPVTEKSEENEVKEEEEEVQQITIVVPTVEQVVVVSGEDASSSSDDNSSGLAGTRRDSVDSYASSEGSGNLGDVEADICDKSSEDGTASTSSGDIADESTGKQIAQKIISQVESMFSDEHLAKDGFLLKHVRRRSDGFVSLKLVAGLRKVKQISREFPVVLDALKDSSKLEINSEGTKVRRVEPLTSFLKSVPIKSKDKETGKSSDENQLPTPAIHQNNKSPSKSGNKENASNENGNKQGGGAHHNQSRRNSNAANGNQSRRNSNAQGGNNPHHRKSSNTSTASSNNSSRHNSFSKAPGVPPNGQHPADLFRNVYMATYSSSGEDSPQQGRRRGNSLPIAALQRASQSNGAYLSPNSSPPNGTLIIGPNGARPKSNSYCEGASPTTMSPWLQRRKASATSRLSNGELVLNGVVRQPRGPDGTKGFASGYRAMILEERLQQQQNSAVSA